MANYPQYSRINGKVAGVMGKTLQIDNEANPRFAILGSRKPIVEVGDEVSLVVQNEEVFYLQNDSKGVASFVGSPEHQLVLGSGFYAGLAFLVIAASIMAINALRDFVIQAPDARSSILFAMAALVLCLFGVFVHATASLQKRLAEFRDEFELRHDVGTGHHV